MENIVKVYAEKYGIPSIVNKYGEVKHTTIRSGLSGRIIFENGWCASIINKGNGYSVAPVDYCGYFDWETLNKYGANGGCLYCNDEEEIVKVCEIIRNL